MHFRPRAAYGLNFYTENSLTVSINFGGNIRLRDKLFYSVTSDIEFDQTFLVVPKEYLSNSLLLGIGSEHAIFDTKYKFSNFTDRRE